VCEDRHVPDDATPPGPGRARQGEIYLDGLRGRRPAVPTGAIELERRARERLSPEAFAYIAGGAGIERTMASNRAALDASRIVPRPLRGVASRDLGLELFGRRQSAPFLLAPMGALELAHRDADLAVARAAAAEDVPMILSSQASVAMERCTEALGETSRWFQLYWSTSDELVESFVRRAEACGCDAIVLTVDTPLLGWRPRDLDLGSLPFVLGKGIAQYTSDPVFGRLVEARRGEPMPRGRVTVDAIRALVTQARRHPGGTWSNLRSGRGRAAVRLFLEIYSRPELSWEQVEALRSLTRLPILLKGILRPDDARRAVDLGVDGIVVSNHGGRQIDGAIASADALPGVVEAVGGRVPVLADGGVRGGADAFKALALGARAVLIGRAYAYGLALAGETGVREVIRNFVAELDLTMALTGCASLEDLGPELLAPP
jgi:lactate 2-monooxygenase